MFSRVPGSVANVPAGEVSGPAAARAQALECSLAAGVQAPGAGYEVRPSPTTAVSLQWVIQQPGRVSVQALL